MLPRLREDEVTAAFSYAGRNQDHRGEGGHGRDLLPNRLAGLTAVPEKGASDRHVFTSCCGQNTQPQQLVVGLRGTGPDGGGWTGVRVTYRTQDGTRHVLSTPVAGLLCGNSTDPC